MFALALAVKCFMDGCSHECSAHALLGHKVAVVSTEAVFFLFSFYLSHIRTMPCERCKACDPFPIMWKRAGSRHWVKGVEEGCVSLRLV